MTGVAALVFVVERERHVHQRLLPLLLQELLEPDLLLLDRQDCVRIHAGHQASHVATLLALPPGLDRHLRPDQDRFRHSKKKEGGLNRIT